MYIRQASLHPIGLHRLSCLSARHLQGFIRKSYPELANNHRISIRTRHCLLYCVCICSVLSSATNRYQNDMALAESMSCLIGFCTTGPHTHTLSLSLNQCICHYTQYSPAQLCKIGYHDLADSNPLFTAVMASMLKLTCSYD